jgi:hypothetical protein
MWTCVVGRVLSQSHGREGTLRIQGEVTPVPRLTLRRSAPQSWAGCIRRKR